MVSFITLSFVVFSRSILVYSVNPLEVAEPCLGNFVTQDYDGVWDHSNMTINSTIYFPLTTKYTALVLSKNLYHTPSFEAINETQLETSCLSMKRIGSWLSTNITGYNGTSFLMLMTPTTVPNLFRFNLGFPDVVAGGGYASIALSDNESYNLFDFCFDNGLRSFAVASTRQFLDENTRNIIRAHVRSLGFKEKNFLKINYEFCTEEDGALKTSGNDLPKPAATQTLLLFG